MYFPINCFLSCKQTVYNSTLKKNNRSPNCTDHNDNKIIATSICEKWRGRENGEFCEIALPQQRRVRTLRFLRQKCVLLETIDVVRLLLLCLIFFLLGNCNIYEYFVRGLELDF